MGICNCTSPILGGCSACNNSALDGWTFPNSYPQPTSIPIQWPNTITTPHITQPYIAPKDTAREIAEAELEAAKVLLLLAQRLECDRCWEREEIEALRTLAMKLQGMLEW